MQYDIGLIIPLQEEFQSAREILSFGAPVRERGHFFHPFSIEGSSKQGVAAVLFEMGLAVSAVAATQLLTLFSVRALALVGIAGAMDPDLGLGDVVVASSVDEYLRAAKAVPGKGAEPGFELQQRGASWRAGYDIVSYARNFRYLNEGSDFHRWRESARLRRDRGLQEWVPELAKERPDYQVGSIATGDVVGAAGAFTRWLRQHNDKRTAIEMEAGGAAEAIYRHGGPDLLIVRGISDFADQRKAALDSAVTSDANGGAWRRYAAMNAVSMFAAMVSNPQFPWPAAVQAGEPDTVMRAQASDRARIYQAGRDLRIEK